MYWHGYGWHPEGKRYHVLGRDKSQVKDFTKSLLLGYATERIKEEDAANLLWANDIHNLGEYLTEVESGTLVHFVER